MTYIHYCNIIGSIFTAPQILCALLIHVCFNNFQAVFKLEISHPCGMYIYNEILFSHEKREILLFAITWMDLVGIIPNQTEKRQIPYDVT